MPVLGQLLTISDDRVKARHVALAALLQVVRLLLQQLPQGSFPAHALLGLHSLALLPEQRAHKLLEDGRQCMGGMLEVEVHAISNLLEPQIALTWPMGKIGNDHDEQHDVLQVHV